MVARFDEVSESFRSTWAFVQSRLTGGQARQPIEQSREVATLIAAVRPQPPGTVVKVETGNPAAPLGFGTKIGLEGPVHPAFSGYVAVAAFDRLKRLAAGASPRECVIYVDRGRGGPEQEMNVEKLSQWSFRQTTSSVIVCAIGDEAGRGVIEAIMAAADEWRNGKHRLFEDGDDRSLIDEGRGIAVRVNAPKSRRDAIMDVVHVMSAFIAGLYAVTHLWHLSPYLALGAATVVLFAGKIAARIP